MDFAVCKKLLEENREEYRRRWLEAAKSARRKTSSQWFHAALFEGYFNAYDEALILLNMVDTNDSPANHRHIPKVAAVPRTDGTPGWKFHCGSCNADHFHGVGLGHRAAHCASDTSPYRDTGYILVAFNDVKPEWQ